MLKFDDSYESFENYLYNVHSQLVNRWVDKMKGVPEGTLLSEIPGLKELHDDITRFEYFCKKYLGYEEYPQGHPKQFQFHYIGDDDKSKEETIDVTIKF